MIINPQCKIRNLGRYVYWGMIFLYISGFIFGIIFIINGLVVFPILLFVIPSIVLFVLSANRYLITTIINYNGITVRGLTKELKRFTWDEIGEVGIGYENLGIMTAYLYSSNRTVTEYELMDILRLTNDDNVIVFKLNRKALKTLKYYYPQPLRNESSIEKKWGVK